MMVILLIAAEMVQLSGFYICNFMTLATLSIQSDCFKSYMQ